MCDPKEILYRYDELKQELGDHAVFMAGMDAQLQQIQTAVEAIQAQFILLTKNWE